MRIFAKRFYGFDPVAQPLVAFGKEGNRDALILASQPGDLLLVVGTMDHPTAPHERGSLLGIVEFARIPVDAKDIIDPTTLQPFDVNPDGSLAWPKALPILRAWMFAEPRLKLLDVLKEQLTFEATVRAVQLDEDDARSVMALPRIEMSVPSHPVTARLLGLTDALAQGRPTTGPVPTAWEGLVARGVDAAAWTYAMRFGKRNVWKIGHTQDTKDRLREVNKHVPHEELGERWELILTQKWSGSPDSYAMEQRLLTALAPYRTEGERLRCSEATLKAAWALALA